MAKVLVTGGSIDNRFLDMLANRGFSVSNPKELLDERNLIEALIDVEYYLLGGDEIATETVLRNTNQLKLISFLGVGYENFVDASAAKEMKIAIANTPGTLTESVAEFTIGHFINVRRRIGQYASDFAAGERGHESKSESVFTDSVGILGMGAIGGRVAQILRQGFGLPVNYHNRRRDELREKQIGVGYLELEDLFKQSSAILICASTNDDSIGLVNDSVLNLMQNGSVIVNCAHPSIVDPSGLMSALNAGKLAGAGFDGFYDDDVSKEIGLDGYQPFPLVVTGHIASLTHVARDAMALMAVESIMEFDEKGFATHQVDHM